MNSQSGMPPQGGQPYPPGAQPMGQTSPETITRKKASHTGLIVGVVVIILLVAGVGAAYELGLGPFAKSSSSPAAKVIPTCVQNNTATPSDQLGTSPTLYQQEETYGVAAPSNLPTAGVTILGAGSTFIQPLMDAWETDYTTNTFSYSGVGSGTGVTDLQTFATDFAASDAPLTYTQVNGFGSSKVLTFPESSGGVVVEYNLAGSWKDPLNLSGFVLAQIFSGAITNWDNGTIQKLNPSDALPNEPIVVVHRSDGSGTSFVFQEFMSFDGCGQWSYNYSTTWLGPSTLSGEQACKGSSGVTSCVKATAGAISYVDMTYAIQNSVTYAAIRNSAGNYIVPTLANIASAIADKTAETGFQFPAGNGNWSGVQMLNPPGSGDYPMATFTYTMFFQAPDTAFPSGSSVMSQSIAEGMCNFFEWEVSASEGQSYANALYFVPIPASVGTADLTTIGDMTWGGTQVSGC